MRFAHESHKVAINEEAVQVHYVCCVSLGLVWIMDCGRRVYNNPYYLFKNLWCFYSETIEMKPSICMSAAGDYKPFSSSCFFSFSVAGFYFYSFSNLSTFFLCMKSITSVHYSLSIFHCLQMWEKWIWEANVYNDKQNQNQQKPL